MQSELYVSLSAQVALDKRVTTIATNVANMSTPGYRAEGVSFETILSKKGDQSVAYSSAGQDFISRKAGEVIKTGNPLDVAIQGNGFFSIQTPAGTVYTRDGRMRIQPSGALQTMDGYAVLDAGSTPILLDPDAGPPVISKDGMITQGGRQLGAIGLFSIDDTAKLTRYENSGVIPSKPATPVLDFATNSVEQGFVEGSNINPVLEMTKLIGVQRAYESIANSVNSSESSLKDAIKTLGGAT